MNNLRKIVKFVRLKILSSLILLILFQLISETAYADPNEYEAIKHVNFYVTIVDSSTDSPLELVNLILQKDNKTINI